jgi:SAM-dependent methyltransferase
MTSPQAPTPNFNRIARPYRWLEFLTLGSALTRCRNHFLPQLTTRREALLFGDGDGRFLARLLAANPALQADAVDISATMLQLLTRNARRAHPTASTRVRTHPTNALTFTPPRPYDLIVTHFFLDCLTQSELDQFTAHLTPHLIPNALWLVSDFRIPSGPMRFPAHALIRLLYFAFRILTGLRTTALPDHAAALTAAGITLTAQHRSLAGLLTTELWAYKIQPYAPAPQPEYTPSMQLPPQRPKTPSPPDPVPDPEPPSPSLAEPDPGVFHHDVAAPVSTCQTPSDE